MIPSGHWRATLGIRTRITTSGKIGLFTHKADRVLEGLLDGG